MIDDLPLYLLAGDQFGLFTARQALLHGHSKKSIYRRVARGTWEEVLPGVFKQRGTPMSFDANVKAATLWAGPLAAGCGRTAAALRDIFGFEKDIIEIVTTRRRIQHRKSIIVRLAYDLPSDHVRSFRGIPLVVPERMMFDLARTCRPRKLVLALDDVLRKGLTTPERLAAFLDDYGRSGRNGTAAIRKVLAARSADYIVSDSGLEDLVFNLLVEADLPVPQKQYPVTVRGITLHPDLAYPESKLAIEALGYSIHGRRDDWERDQARISMLSSIGWRVIPVTWFRYSNDPQGVVREVRDALRKSFS